MKQIAVGEAVNLLKTMTRVLCTVGVLALIFTTVNVTRFATSRNVPMPIAILLDPMIGTALAAVLYVDARLASWGIRPPAWSTTLRWNAGCTAALMNSWESLWPDGQIGWPRQADPAAVLLHLTPALLLIALTETIAAYRRTITDLLEPIDPTDPSEPPAAPALRSAPNHSDPLTTDPDPTGAAPSETAADPPPTDTATSTSSGKGHPLPSTGRRAPNRRHGTPDHPTTNDRASGADVWPRAVALNEAARATTGNPVSVWRLRTDLRVGPRRARQIRDQLLARDHERPPGSDDLSRPTA